jgi:hypothetical protein
MPGAESLWSLKAEDTKKLDDFAKQNLALREPLAEAGL